MARQLIFEMAYLLLRKILNGEKQMKKNTIIGMTLAIALLSVGAVSASAAGSCCKDGNCSDKHTVQQFTQETALLTEALKAKDLELRSVYGYEGIDISKANTLEAEIKDLKGKIKVVADKYGLPACCIS